MGLEVIGRFLSTEPVSAREIALRLDQTHEPRLPIPTSFIGRGGAQLQRSSHLLETTELVYAAPALTLSDSLRNGPNCHRI